MSKKEEENLEGLNQIEDIESAEPEDGILKIAGVEEVEIPKMSDPSWHDYVMSHFEHNELDPNGRPFVHGLRRVVEKLLGEITVSDPEVINFPKWKESKDEQGYKFWQMMEPAVVKHTVEIGSGEDAKLFAEVADVFVVNTDPLFCNYATATCSTRAEARALRKALRIRTIAAEEVGIQTNTEGKIDPSYIDFIDQLCKEINVNVMTLVNANKDGVKYKRIEDIPQSVGDNLWKYISKMRNKQVEIPERFVGYDPLWHGG